MLGVVIALYFLTYDGVQNSRTALGEVVSARNAGGTPGADTISRFDDGATR